MKLVPNAVTRTVARQLLVGQKYSPQLLFIAGVVGVGATVALACHATLQVEDKLEEHEKKVVHLQSLGLKDTQAEVRHAKVQLALEIGKLYTPALLCGLTSVGALAGSNHILNKRNAALAAAYTGLERVFGDYRERVQEQVGPEKEKEIYLGLEKCEIEDEEGKKVKTKRIGDKGISSLYAKLFDEHNVNWSRSANDRYVFLKLQQEWANQRLQSRGHLFLNEVYDALGFERTTAGSVTGWVRDEGDNYVDFGIFRPEKERELYEYMMGHEDSIWLDFNVQGEIYRKI